MPRILSGRRFLTGPASNSDFRIWPGGRRHSDAMDCNGSRTAHRVNALQQTPELAGCLSERRSISTKPCGALPARPQRHDASVLKVRQLRKFSLSPWRARDADTVAQSYPVKADGRQCAGYPAHCRRSIRTSAFYGASWPPAGEWMACRRGKASRAE